MVHYARVAVRVFLVLPLLMAALGLVAAAVQAIELAGSLPNALIAFGLLPIAAWMVWRMAVLSPMFSRWLVRGTVVLASSSMLAALGGLLMRSPVADVQSQPLLAELGGTGLCISAVLVGILAAAALWDEPTRRS